VTADDARIERLAGISVTRLRGCGKPLWVSGERVAAGEESAGRVLLVPPGCGPRLVSYLDGCSGVVCGTVGLTSHQAILAREALVPCVIGIADLAALRGAQRICVLGDTGFVLARWR
jgi:phosphohistidine swiveling domain-containing protein